MTGPEHVIELFHGYTYSGNPHRLRRRLATLDTYKEEGCSNAAPKSRPTGRRRCIR
jgi:beta-alanine--pyruvate transaminase